MELTVRELLSTKPETLAEKQYKVLLQETKATLAQLIFLLDRGDFSTAGRMLANSPAGDGNGCDNLCINFGHLLDPACDGCAADIGDVIARLEELSKLMAKK